MRAESCSRFRRSARTRRMTAERVIVVGYRQLSTDDWALDKIALWLMQEQQHDLAQILLDRTFARYDMSTMPERGDAMDAIVPGVELVVALHLYGIDKAPGRRMARASSPHYGPMYFYCRDNFMMLEACLTVGAVLAAFGDQPWYSRSKFRRIPLDQKLTIFVDEEDAHGAAAAQETQRLDNRREV